MLHPNVTYLYKYRVFNDYSIKSVSENSGWFARPSSFNDPFDCAFTIAEGEFKESSRQLDAQFEKKYGVRIPDSARNLNLELEMFGRLREQVRDLFQNGIGMHCLTEEPDSMLMWSHYGDSHRGFCIQYGRDEGTMLDTIAKPVEYTDSYPSLSYDDLEKIGGGGNDSTSEFLWLTKSSQWSYENEWRIAHSQGDVALNFDFPITGIVFGMRMPEDKRIELRNILAGHKDLKFLQAVASDTEFRVVIEDAGPAT